MYKTLNKAKHADVFPTWIPKAAAILQRLRLTPRSINGEIRPIVPNTREYNNMQTIGKNNADNSSAWPAKTNYVHLTYGYNAWSAYVQWVWKYPMKASFGYFSKKSGHATILTHQSEAKVYLQGNNNGMVNFAKSKKVIIPRSAFINKHGLALMGSHTDSKHFDKQKIEYEQF